MSRDELVRDVARHTDVRVDVVRLVIDGMVDVAAASIINDGVFTIRDLFRVDSHMWPASRSGLGMVVPASSRMVVGLSASIRRTRKVRLATGRPVTPATWRDVDPGQHRDP